MQPQYRRADRVVWRHAVAGVLVRPLDGHDVVTLSGTGVDLWELLREPHTVPALAQRLSERYASHRSSIMDGIGPVLDDLTRRGVVTRAEHP